MRNLTIFYDQDCNLCCTVKQWLMRQETYFPLRMVPLQSELAAETFGVLNPIELSEEILSVDDQMNYYKGPKTWILCLFATVKHRDLALKMNHPLLLPVTKAICTYVSKNRFSISEGLRLLTPRQILTEMSVWRRDECLNGKCKL